MAYKGLWPKRLRRSTIARFWNSQAESIHSRWGNEHTDYEILGDILSRYRPSTLLDAGCGSGRLFPLYRQCGIRNITGVDISAKALEIAHLAFPDADLRQLDLTDLDFPDDRFDFCVCNRVLQHVPYLEIRGVIMRLCRQSRLVYVNEMTQSDGQREAFFMKQHSLHMMFKEVGLECLEGGLIRKQTYSVFGRLKNLADDIRKAK